MATDFKNTEDYEKLAFDEEKEALECVEEQIDGMLAPLQEKIAKLDRDLRNWHPADYDDITRKKIAINDHKRAIEREEETRSYKAEPYFCHFEAIVDGGEARSFYVGEKGIGNIGQTIVLDWRSPLGKTYRNKSQRQFKTDVEDGKYVHTYDLKLRRMVQIKNAKLLDVNTEFDTADMSLDGEIIDPFLLSVLRDKRRKYKISDIIKTIQQRQNEILELPIDGNFIVQGCAGSGKTMILLHRLSYLAFNHPKTDFTKYVVLTPSQSFNEHIDELCEQLELGKIARMTVESYYVRLGRQLSRNDTYVKGGVKDSRKILPKVAFEDLRIIPELQLPLAYLERIYSVAFSMQLGDVVAGFQKAALAEIENSGVANMLEAKGESLPGNAVAHDLFLGLRQSCRKIRSEVDAAFARVTEKRVVLEGVVSELEKVSSAYRSAVATLDPIAASAKEQAALVFHAMEEELEDVCRNLKNAQLRLKTAEQLKQKAHDSLSQAQGVLDGLSGELSEVRKAAEGSIDIDEAKKKPAVQAAAREVCVTESEAIVTLKGELSRIGVFGFGKKRRLREDIRRAEEAYKQAYETALDKVAGDHIRKLREICEEALERIQDEMPAATQQRDDLAAALLESQERCNDIKAEIEVLRVAVGKAKAPIDALRPFIDAFEKEDYPDASKLTGADVIQAWSEELAAYLRTYLGLTLDQRRYLKQGRDRLRILGENLVTAKRDLAEAEGMTATEEEVRLLNTAETIAEGLDAKLVKQAFYEEIDSLRKEYGVEPADSANYRHDLYLRLLFCYLYYGSVDGAGVCVSIDEAQDLSKAEIALIKGILGPEAVINLYGDTGQMIYPHRGISDWAETSRMISASVYTLDENYRNTLQITGYCNQRLGLGTVGVGLDGAEVVETGLREAIEELFALRASHDGLRCSIVYRRGLAGMKGTLDELLGKDASFGVVDPEKISVIPVEAAKGLEFDAVAVIENGMSENELYIALTRALDNLIVVNLRDAEFCEDDEISGKAPAEAADEAAPEMDIKPMDHEKTVTAEDTATAAEEGEDDPFDDFDLATKEERAFAAGERVKLSIDNSVEGVVTVELPPVGGMRRYQVFHGAGDIGEYYANQLSPFDESPQTASALTLDAFLASYAARKLTLPSYSSLFSLNAGKIKFIPYQFRPLKKIVKADRPRLLVADEVGVGKTIETGIIIKEFERRESIESILVVCPKELAPKWQREMKTRFDEPFSILDGPTLDYCIREMELEGEWPYQHAKCIAGLEMIRREETANKLMGLEDGLRFDMLVLDEAHHVVNTASNSYAILDYLSDCSDIAVFLSATPIQLRSRDLFVLLSLLLPEDFTNESLFNEMAEPNQYLNAAIRNIRSSTKEGWQERASDALSHVAGSSAWAAARYGGNRQLTYWCDRLPGDALSDEERMSCLRDLEDLHSFAHVINRTKRRDIGEFTLREPVTVEIAYSPEEQAFYEAAHEFALGIYTAQHGTLVARMIMATIDRLMTSCLPAFAGMLDSFTSRGLLSIRGLSDDMDLDIDDVELTDALAGLAGELKVLAERLPERDAKTEKLIDIIKETSAGDEDGKLLVFSFFKHTLRYLERSVSKAGVRCAVITGDSPSEERDKLRERFRLPKEDPLAIDVLLSSEVGCEGLDYEFCSRMVNYDIPWNPMKIEQRIGRIDRFGQKSPKVRIYNFITQGTVEERIFFRCFERLGIFSSTVGDLEGVLGGVESDLTKIAYDLSLSDEQKAEKAQQGIDNAIRDAEEQREFESNSKDLFLMDLATEDELVGSERDMQMALLQRLLVEYLSAACPSSQFEIVNPGQVRARMFRSDKDRLLKKLVKLRRARKVESASGQYKQLECYLQSDAQVITLDFDGSKESDPESALFVSLSNPLVVMAIDEQLAPTSSQNVTLATRSPILPKGTYSFACCEWEQKGYRNTTDIEAVVLDRRTGAPVDMGLVDFEALLLSCETAWYEEEPDEAALDELLYRKQVAAKKRLAEVNDDIITSKVAILDESFSCKIAKAHSAAMASKNAKIRTMKERQAQNLQVLWDDKRDALLERRAADIIVRRFATGTIEVM